MLLFSFSKSQFCRKFDAPVGCFVYKESPKGAPSDEPWYKKIPVVSSLAVGIGTLIAAKFRRKVANKVENTIDSILNPEDDPKAARGPRWRNEMRDPRSESSSIGGFIRGVCGYPFRLGGDLIGAVKDAALLPARFGVRAVGRPLRLGYDVLNAATMIPRHSAIFIGRAVVQGGIWPTLKNIFNIRDRMKHIGGAFHKLFVDGSISDIPTVIGDLTIRTAMPRLGDYGDAITGLNADARYRYNMMTRGFRNRVERVVYGSLPDATTDIIRDTGRDVAGVLGRTLASPFRAINPRHARYEGRYQEARKQLIDDEYEQIRRGGNITQGNFGGDAADSGEAPAKKAA